MKKLVMLAAMLALVVALAVPAVAEVAEKPVQDPNCSFEKGRTTCVKTELVDSSTTAEVIKFGAEGVFCATYIYSNPRGAGAVRAFSRVYVYQDYRTDTYETTTTIYRGKSDIVKSEDKTTSQTTKPVGDTYYLYYTGPYPYPGIFDPEAYEKRPETQPCLYEYEAAPIGE